MTDSTFRTQVEQTTEITPEKKESTVDGNSKAEIPYTDYEKENNHPFIVDHYKLGDNWKDQLGGFQPEVTLIEEFISNRISKGEIPNNIKAVQDAVKGIEKMTNVDKNERATIKLETMAAYVKFLMTADKIKFNSQRYANN